MGKIYEKSHLLNENGVLSKKSVKSYKYQLRKLRHKKEYTEVETAAIIFAGAIMIALSVVIVVIAMAINWLL